MTAVAPPPAGSDWKVWARQLGVFLSRALPTLQFKTGNETAATNGVMLWDDVSGYPVVSRNNQFVEVVVKVDVPPTSAGSAGDKAGLISWDTNYIFICNGTYDGSTNIWTRTSHLGGSW
jgi:hypothetical protein